MSRPAAALVIVAALAALPACSALTGFGDYVFDTEAPADAAPDGARDALAADALEPADSALDAAVTLDAFAPDGAPPDAGPADARPRPHEDGGCTSDLECGDFVRCTDDRCVGGGCSHEPNLSRCDVFEACTAMLGCVGGVCRIDADCADSDTCTRDVCRDDAIPTTFVCTHAPDPSCMSPF